MTFLLFKLTEKYDGLTNVLIKSICDLLDLVGTGKFYSLINNINNIEYNLSFPKDFILQNKDSILVDTCFFIFNSLCKNFSNSKQFKLIKSLILQYQNDLIPGNKIENQEVSRLSQICLEPIVADKITFFLGLYSEILFLELSFVNNIPIVVLSTGYEIILKNSILFLFKCLLNYVNNPGTSYQACFSLKNLLSISILKPYYDTFFGNLFDDIVIGIKEIGLYPFYDLIIDILTNPKLKDFKNQSTEKALLNNIEENSEENDSANKILKEIQYTLTKSANKSPFDYNQLIKMVNSCVERILKETKSIDNNNTILCKCMNILIIISENFVLDENDNKNESNNNLFNNNNPNRLFTPEEFELLLFNLTGYIKNPNKINFDLEIIDYISIIQKKSCKLLKSTILIFNNLQKLINKNNGISKSLYDLLYDIIEKGTDLLIQNIELISKNINNENINDDDSIENNNLNINTELGFEYLVRIITEELNEFSEEDNYNENTYYFTVLILQKLIQVRLL